MTGGTERFMTLQDPKKPLDDGNTVGIIDGFDPGPATVTYSDEEAKFRNKTRRWAVGDDDSTIFVASDDGELSLGYGPQFDKTIVTNLKRHQLKKALNALKEANEHHVTGDFDVHFDHAGPIVFDGEIMVATTPLRFPWDFGSVKRPRSPCGPSIRGGIDG